ncbi:TonB-dependent siderophore receptor [Salinisphaera sp. T5B8]
MPARARCAHITTLALCGTTVAALPVCGLAQQDGSVDNGDPSQYRLAPVIVNAGVLPDDNRETTVARELWMGGKVATSIQDTPASVSVITEKEIEQRDANTTEQVLQYTPGVVTDYYSTDDRNDYFQIRGFQATTYRDGLTLGSMRGVREEPFAYERIEVLRGANSTLFGPADPGGSVNFVSKRPKFESFGLGYLSYSSFNSKEVGVDVGDTLNEDETLAYRFVGKFKDGKREYDYSEDDDQFVLGGITWEPSAYTSATFIFDYLDQDNTPNSGGYPLDREYSRNDFFGEPGFNYHDVERTSATGLFTHDFDNGLTLQANARYSDLTDDFGYVYLTDSPARAGTVVDRDYFGTDSEAEELIGNAILQYDISFDHIDSSTLAGVEYRDASTEDSSIYGNADPIDIADPEFGGAPENLTVFSANDQDFKTQSVFATQNLSFYDRVVATAGIRHDWLDLASTDLSGVRTSDDFSETSVRGALTYKFTEQLSAYISQVESVAPPTIGVEPERGEQYEIGVKYAPRGMNALFSAAIYDLSREDITIAVVQDSGVIERETIGESRARGLDLEAKAELTANLSVTGGYSYLDAEVIRGTLRDGTSLEGNEPAIAPEHTAKLWAFYSVPRIDTSFGLGARYTGSYYFDAANTNESDAATLFDAALTHVLSENTDITVNVRNLLDEQHVVGSGTSDFYNDGREITARLSYQW